MLKGSRIPYSIHCIWATVAVPGILVPEALVLGKWVQAQDWAELPNGQATYLGNPDRWGTLPAILAIQFIVIAFVEHQHTTGKDTRKRKNPSDACTQVFEPGNIGFNVDGDIVLDDTLEFLLRFLDGQKLREQI